MMSLLCASCPILGTCISTSNWYDYSMVSRMIKVYRRKRKKIDVSPALTDLKTWKTSIYVILASPNDISVPLEEFLD